MRGVLGQYNAHSIYTVSGWTYYEHLRTPPAVKISHKQKEPRLKSQARLWMGSTSTVEPYFVHTNSNI